jgi:hypothetical protein
MGIISDVGDLYEAKGTSVLKFGLSMIVTLVGLYYLYDLLVGGKRADALDFGVLLVIVLVLSLITQI